MEEREGACRFSVREARAVLALALPVFTAQITQMAMSFVDTVVAGRYGSADMAAVSVASSFWIPGIMFGQGMMMAITPLVAQARGAGDAAGARSALRQGLWLALVLSCLLVAVFHATARLVASCGGMDAVLAAKTSGYLEAVLWGAPALMAFCLQRAFLEGSGRTRPAMIAGFLGLALNIPLNIVFVFGMFGLPEMGAAGCGAATSVLLWAMAASMAFFVRRADPGAQALARPDRAALARLARLGLPSALALLNESAAFALVAVLSVPLGTVQLAGHQAAGNVSGITWMVPYSIGTAACIRTGAFLGAGDMEGARLARRTSLCLSLAAAGAVAACLLVLRHAVAGIYSTDPGVIGVASSLLVCEALYQFPDAVQTNTLFGLRAWNDTRSIFIGSFLAYWVVSLPLGWALCYGALPFCPPLGVAGFWIALIAGLLLAGVFYLVRLSRLERLSAEEMLRRIGA